MNEGIHATAAQGFDRAGEDYERGRPGYPPAALEHLIAALRIGPGRAVLDLAAGTGKLTRALAETGAEVIAVEPVEGMRGQLIASAPGARVLNGTAERIPLPDASVDAVTVAQAFHWFHARTAAVEIHRVLRRGGGLAVIWNAWDITVPWVARIQEMVHAHTGGAPQQSTSHWPDELEASGLFSPLREEEFGHVLTGGLDTLRARVASVSYISALPDSERAEVLDAVSAVVGDDQTNAGQATLTMPYTAHVACCEAG